MTNLLNILIKYVHGPLLSVTTMSNYMRNTIMSNPGQNIIIRSVTRVSDFESSTVYVLLQCVCIRKLITVNITEHYQNIRILITF